MAGETPRAAGEPVAVLAIDHAVGGYLHGLAQPFLQAHLRFALPAAVDWAPVDEALATAIADADPPGLALSTAPVAGALQRILHWTAEFQRSATDAVFEAGRILWQIGDGAELTVVALPTIDATIAAPALTAVTGIIGSGVEGKRTPPALLAAVQTEIDQLMETRRRRLNSGGADMNHFLRAAHERRMPWCRVGGSGVFQIGHGARAHWLESTFTDATSVLGARIARNKAAAASVLRQIGLPVPPHLAVRDEEMAVTAAQELGYPVVVKPLDVDGGFGVHVGLKTPEAVRGAYSDARRHSERVLVEKLVEGRDYRLYVFREKLIWAIERVPGGVTGDGERSVRQLLEAVNLEPRRTGREATSMKPMIFDAEAVALLAERGMDADSIPAQGERIRLRGAANINSGGEPFPVLDKVHPDNKMLVERAARALRLDLAGVDLLIPDIGQSWRETGAGICEVNGQPTFGTAVSGHLYGEVLDLLIQGDGRIPIAMVVGAPDGSKACELLARIVGAAGPRVGLATRDGVWIGRDSVLPGPADTFAGARLLIGDPAVEAAIVAVHDLRSATTGMPFDRCAVVALAGSDLENTGGGGSFQTLAQALLPMTLGRVVINAQDFGCMGLAPQAQDRQLILFAAEPGLGPVLEHRAKGGAAVWVEETADGGRVVVAAGAGEPLIIALANSARDDDLRCGPRAVALAVAVAGALGCGESQLRQGLAGLRLQAAPARVRSP
ncbi:MAG: acetate--CoA ligase family protein [Caulobacterales bacterium]